MEIIDRDLVRVYNNRGALIAGTTITDRSAAGVVQMATGA
ncbi:hypothetical protein I1A62_01060 (plasmid) [Rhodococcus sp. USK10]|nr:hypothetical protein I1A62_01060 [Rhodococcus sp. USK10]